MNLAETPYSLVCVVRQSDAENLQALRDSLVSETESKLVDLNSLSFELREENAKDLRAMWNTRIRGLIAAEEILQAIESAGSSTKDDSGQA